MPPLESEGLMQGSESVQTEETNNEESECGMREGSENENDEKEYIMLINDPKTVPARFREPWQKKELQEDRETSDNGWLLDLLCKPFKEDETKITVRKPENMTGIGWIGKVQRRKESRPKELDLSKSFSPHSEILKPDHDGSSRKELDIQKLMEDTSNPKWRGDQVPWFKDFRTTNGIQKYFMAMMPLQKPRSRAYIAYIWNRDFRPSPVIDMWVEGVGPRKVLIDSGAGVSLISTKWFEAVRQQWGAEETLLRHVGPAWEIAGVNGPDLLTMGKYQMIFQLKQGHFPVQIAVSKDPSKEGRYYINSLDAILGMNFILKHGVILDFAQKIIQIGDQIIPYVQEVTFHEDEEEPRIVSVISNLKSKGHIPDQEMIHYQSEETWEKHEIEIKTKFQKWEKLTIPEKRKLPPILEEEEKNEEEEVVKFRIESDLELTSGACSWVMMYTDEPAETGREIPSQILMPGLTLLKTEWARGETRAWVGLKNDLNEPFRLKDQDFFWVQTTTKTYEKHQSYTIGAMDTEIPLERDSPEYRQEWERVKNAVIARAEDLEEKDKTRLSGLFNDFFNIMRLKHEAPGLAKNYEVEVELTTTNPIYL